MDSDPNQLSRQDDHGVGRAVSPLLLLPTDSFVAELHERLVSVRSQVCIQLMTFDGDTAGQAVADALIEAAERGVSVRLLIDSFVEKAVSDTSVRRPEVSDEFVATNAMYERLRQNGVVLRFTNPTGRFGQFTFARNHKKLFVLDDSAYLGGVNVSDHNFAWHDFMVRVEVPEIVDTLLADFEATMEGRRLETDRRFRRTSIGPTAVVTDGAIEGLFDELIVDARQEVVLASPYADDVGLCRVLARCKAPNRTIILPRTSNVLFYRLLGPYTRWRLRRAGVSVTTYRNFSHSKFLLIDDASLLIGSSNFGRHSFWYNQEICLLITDPDFIAHFKAAMTDDVESIEEKTAPLALVGGALVAYFFHACLLMLRRVMAPRVPVLSPR